MARMHVYYINLERSTRRRQSMEQQLKVAGLEYTRIKAVDGKDLNPRQLERMTNWLWSWILHGQRLTAGEIACMASHLLVYQQILSDGIDFAIVLEDDVAISKELTTILPELTMFSKQFDLISLHTNRIRGHLTKVAELGTENSVFELKGRKTSAAAYFITSIGAAKMMRLGNCITTADKYHFFERLVSIRTAIVTPNLVELSSEFSSQSEIDEAQSRQKVMGQKIKRSSVFWRVLARPVLPLLLRVARFSLIR